LFLLSFFDCKVIACSTYKTTVNPAPFKQYSNYTFNLVEIRNVGHEVKKEQLRVFSEFFERVLESILTIKSYKQFERFNPKSILPRKIDLFLSKFYETKHG
jgi:hypothetical protein